MRSQCDAALGYAKCDQEEQACDLARGLGGNGSDRTVTRGTYENPIEGDCATYFRCNIGWFKRFSPFGVVECAPCDGKQALARYVTAGLSANEPQSCLWECDNSRQTTAWYANGSGCVFVSALAGVASHSSGWYGVGGSSSRYPVATCPEMFTTEANTSLRAGDCLECPTIPLNARRVVGARNCEWQCDGGWTQRGQLCVRVHGADEPCRGAGMTRDAGGMCVPSSVPWNAAGYGKVAPLVSVSVVAAVNASGWTGPVVRAKYQDRRHWVEIWSRDRVRLVVQTEGPMCSASIMWMAGVEYLVGAVCNQSFLAFVNLSSAAAVSSSTSSTTAVYTTTARSTTSTTAAPTTSTATSTTARSTTSTTARSTTSTTARSTTSTPPATTSSALAAMPAVYAQVLRVLIGQAGNPGWADGFKTQARFGVELYVTSGATNGSLWVLDRWNCVVREVSVWQSNPGDYRTRVFTVHGLTEKFALATPEPKCYGAGSLAGPRRFWELSSHSVVLFSDDNGLWQLALESGELGQVMSEGWDLSSTLEADELASVRLGGDSDISELLLEFRDGTVWSVVANVEPCPDGTTSERGGDCAVACVWRADGAGYYVDRLTGACVSCAAAGAGLVCTAGEEKVLCTRDAPPKCRKCPVVGEKGRKYVELGKCDEDLTRYVVPCPVGYYKNAQSDYCDRCPDELSTTVFAGATRVEQCKCLDGLRLSKELGRCVGEELYVYEDGVCVASPAMCNVPPHARLVDGGTGRGRCVWECDVGYYHAIDGPWMEKCQECKLGAGDIGNATTRGDSDSPWSCEYS